MLIVFVYSVTSVRSNLTIFWERRRKRLKDSDFFWPQSSNTHQGFVNYPWSEILDGTLVKVRLVKPSFSQPSPTFDLSSNRAKVSVSSLWGIAFPPPQPPAALLSLAGKFSKGDGECDWGVSSWHLWITKIAGAAGGATASNGSLIFLDVERRDPVRDSPQLEKAHFAQVDSAKVMDRLSHQNWYESNLEQRWIYIFFPPCLSTEKEDVIYDCVMKTGFVNNTWGWCSKFWLHMLHMLCLQKEANCYATY